MPTFSRSIGQEWGTQAERDIERRHEPEVGPVGSLKDQSIAKRSTYGVRRDKDPFRSGRERPTESLQLIDKGIHRA